MVSELSQNMGCLGRNDVTFWTSRIVPSQEFRSVGVEGRTPCRPPCARPDRATCWSLSGGGLGWLLQGEDQPETNIKSVIVLLLSLFSQSPSSKVPGWLAEQAASMSS